MGILISFAISAISVVLNVVSLLDVIPHTPTGIYQPKAPKALIK